MLLCTQLQERFVLPRPLSKPVNCATVDQGWEHTAAGPEGVSNWTHADNNVQTFLHSTDKVIEYSIPTNKELLQCMRQLTLLIRKANKCLLGAVGSASVS